LLRAVNVPVISTVAQQGLEIMGKPNKSASEIAEVLSRDPVLTVEILRVANSVAYGRLQPTENVREAIVRLGRKVSSNLVLAACVKSLSSGKQSKESKAVWEHSVATAIAAKRIAEVVDFFQNACFIGGIVHDVGHMLIASIEPQALRQLAAERYADGNPNPKEPVLVSERKLFGFDHASLGETLMRKWKLQRNMVTLIKYHHASSEKMAKLEPRMRKFVAIIQLANHVATTLGLGSHFGDDVLDEDDELPGTAISVAGLHFDELAAITLEVDRALQEEPSLRL